MIQLTFNHNIIVIYFCFKVIFSSELMLPDKLRITVENQNKTVTYDWIVDDPEQPLYFAACMDGQPWKLLVE